MLTRTADVVANIMGKSSLDLSVLLEEADSENMAVFESCFWKVG